MWEEIPNKHLSHNQYNGYTMPRAIMIFAQGIVKTFDTQI
jgi:hypothetical protein